MSDSTADWSVMTQAQKDAALRSARAQGMREAEVIVGHYHGAGADPCCDKCGRCMWAGDIADIIRTRADAIERGE